MYVVYWRCKSNVVDMRKFENLEELKEWLLRQLEIEPTAIVGIYDESTPVGETEKHFKEFKKYFERS